MRESVTKRIHETRRVEAETIWGNQTRGMLHHFQFMLFPDLMPMATYAMFIYLGYTLDYKTAVGSFAIFEQLKRPLVEAPNMMTDITEFIDGMKRI